MPVSVSLSTTLRASVPGYSPATGLTLDLDAPVSARGLAENLGLPLEMIKIIMVNGRHASLDQMIHDGDRVAYFPAVGGG